MAWTRGSRAVRVGTYRRSRRGRWRRRSRGAKMGSRWSSSFRPATRRIGVVALSLLALAIVAPGSAVAGGVRNVQILDRCDPDGFNAMFGDGVCILRNGGVPVEQF